MAQEFIPSIENYRIKPMILTGSGVADYYPEGMAAQMDKGPKHFSLNRIKAKLPDALMSSTLLYGLREHWIGKKIFKFKKIMYSFLIAEKFSAVISLSDRNHDYVESCTLFAAKTLGLKIILPYLAIFDIDSSLQYRKGINGKILPEFLPFQSYSIYKVLSYFRLRATLYKGIFFQAPFLLNAHRKQQTLSNYPWWVGNGLSDVVCVDSQRTSDVYLSHGVPHNKIKIMGHVEYDKIHASKISKEKILNELNFKYKFNSLKKLVIFSLPQHFEQGNMESEKHFRQMNEILQQLVTVDCNLLISAHPRQDLSNYSFITREYGLNIVNEKLCDIIGASNLFVASNSSTLTWATLCGIPAINLLGPIENLFGHLSSITYISDFREIFEVTSECLKKPPLSFENDWQCISKDSVFDGKCTHRFLKLLES
jgi:hypothetical protein